MKAFLKLCPVLVLAGMLLSGVDILLAAPTATVLAGILAFALERHSYKDIYHSAIENAKNLIDILFILMISFALAEVFMASGVGASIIIVAVKIGLTGKTVASAALLVTAILSVATGTSWGTFAACAPVFLWLSHIIGGSPLLTISAIAGGCCFGDNIGLISDTTVLSSGVHQVEVTDRVRHQGAWSITCLLVAAVVFFLVSVSTGLDSTAGNANAAIDSIPAEVWTALEEKRASAVTLLQQVRDGVPLYMLLPLIAVVVTAVMGVGTVICLGLGIFLLMRPSTALNVVCYALGGVVLVCAAVQLVRYFAVERGIFQSQLTLISGIICLGLGAFLILRSDIVVRILPIVFGLFVIFDSLGRIQNALDLRRCEYPSWKGFLLLPVLSVVLGVVMILNPFGTMETLVMAIGIILIIEGAINLLSALYTVLAIRRFSKLHPETQSMLESLTGQDLNGDGVIAPDIAPADVEASAVELDHVDESAEVEQEED